MSILERIESYIIQENMIAKGERIIAAVSGGPDSTALLYILKELSAAWDLKLHVAHMEHGFRGEESLRDAEWVRELAARLELPCTIRHADIPAVAVQRGGNAQEIAREVRYQFLLETARSLDARSIALGHHADDQAETVLMNLLRGASLSGLAGMAPVTVREGVKLFRPLLRIYKDEIEAYLHERGLAYRTDSSNMDRSYTRNRLRLDLMPLLKTFNPEFVQAINRTADLIRDEDRLLSRLAESEAQRIFRSVQGGPADSYIGSRAEWLELDVALQRRVIKLILSYLCENQDIQSIHIEQVREAIAQDASPSLVLHLPGVTFRREYDRLQFARGHLEDAPRPYEYRVSLADDRLAVAETGIELVFDKYERSAGRSADDEGQHGIDQRSAYFDLDELPYPLTVRNRRPGDRIQLWNTQGSKKLKDLFIDLKIPPSKRDAIPLIVDAEGRVLWVCGVRRSRHAPVQPGTKNILQIKLVQNERNNRDID